MGKLQHAKIDECIEDLACFLPWDLFKTVQEPILSFFAENCLGNSPRAPKRGPNMCPKRGPKATPFRAPNGVQNGVQNGISTLKASESLLEASWRPLGALRRPNEVLRVGSWMVLKRSQERKQAKSLIHSSILACCHFPIKSAPRAKKTSLERPLAALGEFPRQKTAKKTFQDRLLGGQEAPLVWARTLPQRG